ncbi:2-dehydropantoate 2-reductase [Roseateles oligotrophus]|uniref:2-dehydropantoate 2-reductase n=1 Tax=Roseateles oligotrophus TaxID=1769250 RepID=A0ABT2YL43_9BURK|nr:2-dehydropantoate 2-reductase [Roseateles oligotrophus]MCV2370768.1 2-dehydropantoate 2-reductase [Roseateles oligotrophus]
MKICIVGAGAIGGWFAAHVGHQLGSEVQLSALARGATLDALRAHGLRMDKTSGEHISVPILASDKPEDLGQPDLVVIAVKGPALAAVAPAVKALLGPQTRVLVAMNGVPWWFFNGLQGPCQGLQLRSVDPGGVIAASIPAERVIGSVVHASCSSPEPGLVKHVMGMGLILGDPAGGRPAHVTELADLLGRAGFNATVSERIQKDIWYKLWGNMTMNPISALTGATCDRILDDDLVCGFVTAVMLEAGAIGERIGCPVGQTPQERHAVTRKLGAFKTSMLQDVEAGRPLELDALVASVREIGQHIGLATPYTDAMLGLTRLMAQTRGLL